MCVYIMFWANDETERRGDHRLRADVAGDPLRLPEHRGGRDDRRTGGRGGRLGGGRLAAARRRWTATRPPSTATRSAAGVSIEHQRPRRPPATASTTRLASVSWRRRASAGMESEGTGAAPIRRARQSTIGPPSSSSPPRSEGQADLTEPGAAVQREQQREGRAADVAEHDRRHRDDATVGDGDHGVLVHPSAGDGAGEHQRPARTCRACPSRSSTSNVSPEISPVGSNG